MPGGKEVVERDLDEEAGMTAGGGEPGQGAGVTGGVLGEEIPSQFLHASFTFCTNGIRIRNSVDFNGVVPGIQRTPVDEDGDIGYTVGAHREFKGGREKERTFLPGVHNHMNHVGMEGLASFVGHPLILSSRVSRTIIRVCSAAFNSGDFSVFIPDRAFW